MRETFSGSHSGYSKFFSLSYSLKLMFCPIFFRYRCRYRFFVVIQLNNTEIELNNTIIQILQKWADACHCRCRWSFPPSWAFLNVVDVLVVAVVFIVVVVVVVVVLLLLLLLLHHTVDSNQIVS